MDSNNRGNATAEPRSYQSFQTAYNTQPTTQPGSPMHAARQPYRPTPQTYRWGPTTYHSSTQASRPFLGWPTNMTKYGFDPTRDPGTIPLAEQGAGVAEVRDEFAENGYRQPLLPQGPAAAPHQVPMSHEYMVIHHVHHYEMPPYGPNAGTNYTTYPATISMPTYQTTSFMPTYGPIRYLHARETARGDQTVSTVPMHATTERLTEGASDISFNSVYQKQPFQDTSHQDAYSDYPSGYYRPRPKVRMPRSTTPGSVRSSRSMIQIEELPSDGGIDLAEAQTATAQAATVFPETATAAETTTATHDKTTADINAAANGAHSQEIQPYQDSFSLEHTAQEDPIEKLNCGCTYMATGEFLWNPECNIFDCLEEMTTQEKTKNRPGHRSEDTGILA